MYGEGIVGVYVETHNVLLGSIETSMLLNFIAFCACYVLLFGKYCLSVTL